MTRILDPMFAEILLPTARSGAPGLVLAAIAACEVRTMGMGLHRSDGRNAGIFDGVLLPLAGAGSLAFLIVGLTIAFLSLLSATAARPLSQPVLKGPK